jgi:hypothetical protein
MQTIKGNSIVVQKLQTKIALTESPIISDSNIYKKNLMNNYMY